ncbi:hypothetical protein [Methylobacterium sp. 1973]|uniref:hypothetical protein n=1 Tax=Methylobacterium sp. 1973 TaxID=3156421 RepID=UPI0033954CD6
MRRWPEIVLTLVLFAAALPVAARAGTPEQRLNRTARAIVRLSVVERFCSQFYLVDKIKADEIAKALLNDIINRFGQQQAKQAIDAMDGEIQPAALNQGAATWCPAQRQHFRSVGVRDLIGGPLR